MTMRIKMKHENLLVPMLRVGCAPPKGDKKSKAFWVDTPYET